jgi:tRNA threonylcarbamoyladenosine biosynthesis protein TsaE
VSVERTAAPAETEALGARLASELEPGDIVLVSGALGSGKTTLVRGACRELGFAGPVQSPTFAIGRRYAGRVPVSHLDLFRLDALESEEPGLLDDYLTPDAVAFVEWPAGAAGAIELEPATSGRVIRVELRHAGGDSREVEVTR